MLPTVTLTFWVFDILFERNFGRQPIWVALVNLLLSVSTADASKAGQNQQLKVLFAVILNVEPFKIDLPVDDMVTEHKKFLKAT